MKIQIHQQNFDLTDPFKEYLENKLNTLEKYQEDILSCQVTLNRDPKHQKGEIFTVEVRLSLPRTSTLIVRETDADARRAVDIVQDKLARQLVKFKDKKSSKSRNAAKYFKSLKFWKRND